MCKCYRVRYFCHFQKLLWFSLPSAVVWSTLSCPVYKMCHINKVTLPFLGKNSSPHSTRNSKPPFAKDEEKWSAATGSPNLPRPQSGPLNPRKQWHVPATQSPFPKQLLGHSSTESETRQRENDNPGGIFNANGSATFLPPRSLRLDYDLRR